MRKRYSTKREVIEQVIMPALDVEVSDFDTDKIFDDCYEYRVDRNAKGEEIDSTRGFQCVVSGEEFWEIVSRHTIRHAV
jgi:hypothetical protein